MNSRILAAVLTVAALVVTAACGGGDNHNNANHSNANANRATNANAIVVTNTNANANTNANRTINGNISRAEWEKDKDYYSGEAKKAGRTVGTGANDAWLWTKVRAQLMTADDLRDSTINVDVENDVVTLSGTVSNGNQKVRAADIAKKTEGVKSVNNKLTVAAGGGGANANANKKS